MARRMRWRGLVGAHGAGGRCVSEALPLASLLVSPPPLPLLLLPPPPPLPRRRCFPSRRTAAL